MSDAAAFDKQRSDVGGPYAWYVLGVLVVVYAFNFIDRNIITILAPYIKADLGLTDAQLGLLFGTAFALFYALFGIPLAKLADTWIRTRTIAIGLALWSAMTAVSGFAGSFAQLGAARVGVGVGEASASPAAYSLLSDWFPREQRATALALYSSGIYIGSGVSLMIGGLIVANWDLHFPAGTAPLGLAGWQAAFLAVGIPGLILAIVVATLREPPRGLADGLLQPRDPAPFGKVWMEFTSVVLPFTAYHLARMRAPASVWRRNVLALAGTVVVVAIVVAFTDSVLAPAKRVPLFHLGGFAVTTNVVQWSAIGFAFYGVFTWVQSLGLRDRPLQALIWGTPTFVQVVIAGGFISFVSYGHAAFVFYYAQLYLGAEPASAGFLIGLIAATGGWFGTAAGGVVGDWLRRRRASGRLELALMVIILPLPFAILTYTTTELWIFYAGLVVLNVIPTMWLGGCATTCQDLVLPRMRGAATAAFFLGTNLIGLALGPYTIGLISDATGSLRVGMLSIYAFLPVVIACLWLAIRNLPRAEASVAERAIAAGEPLPRS